MDDNTTRATTATFWDTHTEQWLAGTDGMPEPLLRWFDSYRGNAERTGLAEPYIGDLRGTPRMVLLGPHAGKYDPAFQSRDGVFANEIREFGSYRAWAASGPYLRDPWISVVGLNRFQRGCLGFTRRWLEQPSATHADMLIFEMYPWHFTLKTADLEPPAGVIDQFVWRPIAEMPTRWVFAFGRTWDDLARS